MKKIILLLSLALSLNAYSQKLVKEYYDWAKTKIKRQYYTDAYGTLNGSYKAYSEYGGIMKQGQCKNDGPIGKWLENYDNGKLHYIKYYDTPGTYDFQVQDGKVISYYEDGKTIKYERNFKKLELDGVSKEYDEKGILIKEGKYVNGIFEPTGITKIKYEEKKEKEETLKKQNEAAAEAKKSYASKYGSVMAEKVKSLSQLRSTATKSDTGLEYVITKSNGEKPADKTTVYVHYAGYFEDGSLFDSSYEELNKTYGKWDENRAKQNGYQPFPFEIGNKDALIRGFLEGLGYLSFGDKATFFIPSKLGYGERGAGAVIPPNANIIFEVEILKSLPGK